MARGKGPQVRSGSMLALDLLRERFLALPTDERARVLQCYGPAFTLGEILRPRTNVEPFLLRLTHAEWRVKVFGPDARGWRAPDESATVPPSS